MAASKDMPHSIDILMVEDNPGDVRLCQEAMKAAKVKNRLFIARDGVEAMEFLRQQGQFADAPRPDLILLDLNLPRKDGREVLAELKTDPNLKSIPVVVLTTSHAEEDIDRAYNLHCNCYITKPVDFDQFMKVVQQVDDFWVNLVTLPKT